MIILTYQDFPNSNGKVLPYLGQEKKFLPSKWSQSGLISLAITEVEALGKFDSGFRFEHIARVMMMTSDAKWLARGNPQEL